MFPCLVFWKVHAFLQTPPSWQRRLIPLRLIGDRQRNLLSQGNNYFSYHPSAFFIGSQFSDSQSPLHSSSNSSGSSHTCRTRPDISHTDRAHNWASCCHDSRWDK